MSAKYYGSLITGWASLPVIREADRLYLAGDIAGRNAILRTVDPTMWNGREILPETTEENTQ